MNPIAAALSFSYLELHLTPGSAAERYRFENHTHGSCPMRWLDTNGEDGSSHPRNPVASSRVFHSTPGEAHPEPHRGNVNLWAVYLESQVFVAMNMKMVEMW